MLIGCYVAVALLLCACASGSSNRQQPAVAPTPTGSVLASFNGVCKLQTATHAADVPAGATIHWSEHPTASNDSFLLQALYASTDGMQTLDNSAVNSAYSGNVVVEQADTVSFYVTGSSCTWDIAVYGSQAQPTPTTAASTGYGPDQPPAAPTLADSYVLIDSTKAVYLDLKDGIVAVTQVQQSNNPPPSYCLVSRTEQDMTYVQSGVTLYVKASYIASTPFTINPDGSIQHEVPQPDGTVATQQYVPGSNADYNAAVHKLETQYSTC